MSTATFAEVNPIESTQPVTQKPFAQVPNRAIEDAMKGELSLEVFRFYCWLCKVSNHQGRSWWSVRRQAEEFGVSTRTISRWRAILVEKHYLWLKKQMGRSTVAIVLDYPGRSAGDEGPFKRATNDTNSGVEQAPAEPNSEEIVGETETIRSVEGDTVCHHEEDTPCPQEEDTASVTQTINKKNKQRTIAAAEKTEPTVKSNSAAANASWDTERWKHVCSVFADVGVDLRGCCAYVFQRIEETRGLRTASNRALRHCAWVLAGRIHRSRNPIGAPLRILIAEEALDTAPLEQEAVDKREYVSRLEQDVSSFIQPLGSNFEKWEQVLENIEGEVQESTFNRWFKTMGARLEDGEVTVICEDEFDACFVKKNFEEFIRIQLEKVGINASPSFSHADTKEM